MTRTISSDGTPLNVTDHGGVGLPILLLHGGGRDSRDWDQVAEGLSNRGYRPMALDLRGHGRTPTAPWNWDLALDDIRSVIAAHNLGAPAIVGHSLGGLLAALWAAQEAECPLAMNMDGHGNPTRAGQFDGLSPDQAAEALRVTSRTLAEMGSGLTEHMRSIMTTIDATDWPAVYRATRCPLLITRGHTSMADILPDEAQDAWRAYEAWTLRSLRAVARETALVEVVITPTAHDPHRETPETMVTLIDTCLSADLEREDN